MFGKHNLDYKLKITRIQFYNNASQIYKTWYFHSLKEKPGPIWYYKIFGEFAEDNRKSQSSSPRKIEDEYAKYILSQADKYESLSANDLWTPIKSEFNIDVGRTRIVEILNSNGYKYMSPK